MVGVLSVRKRLSITFTSVTLFVAMFSQVYAQTSPMEAAESLFSKGKYKDAADRFNEVLKNPFSSPRDISLSQCRVGIIESIQNRNDNARKMLEQSFANGALPKAHSDLCQYALLQIYVMSNANSEARDLLSKFTELNLGPVYIARTWALAAEVGHRLQDNKMEFLNLQKLLSSMEKYNIDMVEIKVLDNRKLTRADVARKIGADSKKSNRQVASSAFAPLDTSEKHKDSVVVEPEKQLSTNTFPNTKITPEPYVNSSPIDAAISVLLKEKIDIRRAKLGGDKPRDMRIGLILPQGNMFTRFNTQIMRAASAFLASTAAEGVNISIHIRAALPEAGAAEMAALNLFSTDGVHALVGPLIAVHAVGIAPVSKLFSVPTFVLGPIGYASEIQNPYMIRLGMLASSQAEVLVEHLVSDLKLSKLAILSPDDAYGFEMAARMADTAKKLNLNIQNTKFFDPTSQVIQQEIVDLVGPQDRSVRKEEYEVLARAARSQAVAEKRKFNPDDVVLPVRLPFDAVFIPDTLNKAKLISSTFAFYDAKEVRYFGERQWFESAGRPSLADEFLNGARVPAPSSGSFLAHLKKHLDAPPEAALSLERQTFDAFMLIRQSQYLSSGNNGELMLASMKDDKFFVDATSHIGPVDMYGEPRYKFQLLSYKNGKLIDQLEPWKFETVGYSSNAQ